MHFERTAGTCSAMQQQQCCVEPGGAMVGPGRGNGTGGATIQHAIQCAAVQQFTRACIDQFYPCLLHTLIQLEVSVLFTPNTVIPNPFSCVCIPTTLNPKACTALPQSVLGSVTHHQPQDSNWPWPMLGWCAKSITATTVGSSVHLSIVATDQMLQYPIVVQS